MSSRALPKPGGARMKLAVSLQGTQPVIMQAAHLLACQGGASRSAVQAPATEGLQATAARYSQPWHTFIRSARMLHNR